MFAAKSCVTMAVTFLCFDHSLIVRIETLILLLSCRLFGFAQFVKIVCSFVFVAVARNTTGIEIHCMSYVHVSRLHFFEPTCICDAICSGHPVVLQYFSCNYIRLLLCFLSFVRCDSS